MLGRVARSAWIGLANGFTLAPATRVCLLQRRRATATPSKNATSSEPSGASRAMLLSMLSGMPGFLPFSIASLTRLAAPLTASEPLQSWTWVLDWDPGLHTQAAGRAYRRPWANFLINKLIIE